MKPPKIWKLEKLISFASKNHMRRASMSLSMRVRATAKVEAVAPERGDVALHQFLKAYRDVV